MRAILSIIKLALLANTRPVVRALFTAGLTTLLTTALASAAKDSAPEGFAQPENPAIAQALALIQKGSPDEALKSLATLSPANPADRLWKTYAEGLALYEQKKPEECFPHFQSIYEEFRNTKGTPDREAFRLAGAALKKIGWYWRNKNEFEKAYTFHSIEYNYYEKYGSPLEIHDAGISLGFDSFELGDMRQTEIWLRRALVAASRITDPQAKTKALGMAYNNLAEPLYTLKRFNESIEAAQLSLKFWTDYEEEAGPKEFRVLWAHYAVGDAFESWAQSLKAEGKSYGKQKRQAQSSFRKCLALADQQGLPAKDRKTITDRIAGVEAL